MTDIFKSPEGMPPAKEVVSVAMCREETPLNVGKLSGERNWPELQVRNLERPRRGHGY